MRARASSGEPVLSGNRTCSYKDQIRVLWQTLLFRACLILYSFSVSGDPAGCNLNIVKWFVKSTHTQSEKCSVLQAGSILYSLRISGNPVGWNWSIV